MAWRLRQLARVYGGGAFALSVALLVLPSRSARAQGASDGGDGASVQVGIAAGPDAPRAPAPAQGAFPHGVLRVGVGGQLHLTRDDRLDQGRVAPAYLDLWLGALMPLWGLHVGPMVGAGVNVSDDGGYTEPVFAWQQWALMPGLAVAHGLDGDFPLLAHLGVPLVVEAPTALPRSGDAATLRSAGAELGVAAAYRLLAGVLCYVELDLGLWRGEGGAHLNGALEGGLMLDYEVLP